MPSEPQDTGRLAWLRSQGLGLVCGQATVLLLAIGSVVIANTRDGASSQLQLDELRPFFDAPDATHVWLYLLVPVMGLYALNTLLATWSSVARKWRSGMRSPFHYGAAVFHVAFLVSLVAHGVNGLWAQDQGVVALTDGWSPLADGTEARVSGVDVELGPGGMPRRVLGHVEVRDADGTRAVTVGYNQPLWSGSSTVRLLASWARQTLAATITDGRSTCVAVAGGDCVLGELRLAVLAVHRRGHWGDAPTAIVETPERERAFLLPGRFEGVSGRRLLLQEVAPTPFMALHTRYAPGVPWAMAAAILLGLGVVLLGRRWIR